jgi:hypothetical protein
MMSEDFLAAVSPKSRPKFYFEKERPSFHTAWTAIISIRLERQLSGDKLPSAAIVHDGRR